MDMLVKKDDDPKSKKKSKKSNKKKSKRSSNKRKKSKRRYKHYKNGERIVCVAFNYVSFILNDLSIWYLMIGMCGRKMRKKDRKLCRELEVSGICAYDVFIWYVHMMC